MMLPLLAPERRTDELSHTSRLQRLYTLYVVITRYFATITSSLQVLR
jgi:hypothetical protein